jgi:hypothetical protein
MRHGKAPPEAVRKRLSRDNASIAPGAGPVQLQRVIAEGLVWVKKCQEETFPCGFPGNIPGPAAVEQRLEKIGDSAFVAATYLVDGVWVGPRLGVGSADSE